MQGFEGMEHLAIEFKDGQKSSVQEEIRNQRKTQREEYQYRLMIKDKQAKNLEFHPAQGYRKDQEHTDNDPEIKEE